MNPLHTTIDSFETLFANHYAKLCYFAMRIVKNGDDAKDIVQETFVNYWNSKDQLALSPAAVNSFLYSSVKNACLNKLRRQKLENLFLNKQELNPSEEAVALNLMIRSEVVNEIHKAITTLPDGCQKVFRMGYLEGLKNPQIAIELGISVNTVKTQKKRGLQLLRVQLNPDFFMVLTLVLLQNCFTKK